MFILYSIEVLLFLYPPPGKHMYTRALPVVLRHLLTFQHCD